MNFYYSLITSFIFTFFVSIEGFKYGEFFIIAFCLATLYFAIDYIRKSRWKILTSVFVFAVLFIWWWWVFLMIPLMQRDLDEFCLETSACEIRTEKKQCGLCGEVESCVMSKETCENLYHATWHEEDFDPRSKPFCRIRASYFNQENCLKAGGDWVNKGFFGDELYECDYTAYCAKMGRKPHKWY